MMPTPTTLEFTASACFALAVLHTFAARRFETLSLRFRDGSPGRNLFHFLGEVEVVFGLWAAGFLAFYAAHSGLAVHDGDGHELVGGALHYLEAQNFTEPAFVFVIMAIAGTRPVIMAAEWAVRRLAGLLPMEERMGFYVATLIAGPLLGSFITEPAAMTVTALILLDSFYSKNPGRVFRYATLGLLFVNISVGGTLTHFAAPPVLMVASKWHWGIGHMMANFGWKAALAVVLGTLGTAWVFRGELAGRLPAARKKGGGGPMPKWVVAAHLLFLAFVVYVAHHPKIFMAAFLFFLGFHGVTRAHQGPLRLRGPILVAFFLAGLVTLGSMQSWWIRPVLAGLGDLTLFLGTTGLTALTDNAALTYLGSLADLGEEAKYNLVAGAVTGGGLTVIANAPNPAGFGILKRAFGRTGISPLGLLLGALPSTALCALAFRLL